MYRIIGRGGRMISTSCISCLNLRNIYTTKVCTIFQSTKYSWAFFCRRYIICLFCMLNVHATGACSQRVVNKSQTC